MNRRGAEASQPALSLARPEAAPAPIWRIALFLLLAAGGCAADLLSKHWIFQWRGLPRAGNEWWIWEGYVGIETALNPGALFGMGAGGGLIFAALSIAAAIGIVVCFFWWRLGNSLLLTVALGIILGGILGNLYDRLGLAYDPQLPELYRRAVRDWILLRYGEHTWPNFNIADSLLVCGAAMLMWHAWQQEKDARMADLAVDKE